MGFSFSGPSHLRGMEYKYQKLCQCKEVDLFSEGMYEAIFLLLMGVWRYCLKLMDEERGEYIIQCYRGNQHKIQNL